MPDTSNQEDLQKHLKGPFSSFAVALRNIRENLISKHEKVDRKNIQEEFLKEIITLSLHIKIKPVIPNSTSPQRLYIEFPVAASWPKESNDPVNSSLHIYSGEFRDAKSNLMPDAVKRIKMRVDEKLNELIKRGAHEGIFDPHEFAFEGHVTEYPESLRKVKGYWRVVAGDFVFLVFYTYYHTDPTPPAEIIAAADDLNTAKAYFLNFLENGCDYFVKLIRDGSESAEGFERSGPHSKRLRLTQDVPVLEDIVSRIQDEITKLRDNNSTEEEGFRETFSVVFVRTGLNQEGRLCFRYIFTNKQRRFLKEQQQDEIKEEIGKRRDKVLEELHKRFVTCGWDSGRRINDFATLGEAIKSLVGSWDKDAEREELLRTSIFVYYAFHPQTELAFDEALNEGPPEDGALCLADSIESSENWVSAQQAFLINQILISKSSDVVSDFINHPFSKYSQYKTPRLLSIFLSNFSTPGGESFYPRVLHLFEMLFFPQRFFMYPIYQYDDVPLLLCAFDADNYRERRSSLKGIVDRYVPAIFSSILAFQLSETSRIFATSKQTDGEEQAFVSTPEAIKHYETVMGWRIKHLLRLFCKEMVYSESLRMRRRDVEEFEDFSKSDDGALVKDDKVLVKVMVMKKPRVYEIMKEGDPPDIIIPSKNGRHLLKLYLEHYADIFSRSVRHTILVKEVERNKVSNAVAHAVKTSLSPLSGLSSVFSEKVDNVGTLLGDIEFYKTNRREMLFGRANLKTSDIPFDKFNSISSVLSFYAEDAEKKVGLLYGGVKKDHVGEDRSIENYIIAGIVRGYCIALIKGVDNLLIEGETHRVKKGVFRINGVEYILRVREIEDTLEESRGYLFDKQDGIVFNINDLKLANILNTSYGIDLGNPIELVEWKCQLLMIVVEELVLNAVTNVTSGDIVINSNPECLFSIENWAATSIPEVKELNEGIRTGVMGGLHTAYFVTKDRDYLRMRFESASKEGAEELKSWQSHNSVWIYEDRHE